MKSVSYELYIDTGGTFTDCLAKDSGDNWHRRKVLSNSALRGRILSWIDRQNLKINTAWELEKDILPGYQFRLLQKKHPRISIEKFHPHPKILTLSDKLPQKFVDQDLSFEIISPEEVPLLAARLITQTPLHETLPPVHIKLGSTKGTNALLENKGADLVFFVTEGFKDILHIGYQQRPDIFALNVVKPPPLHRHVVEVQERFDAQGRVLRPLKYEHLQDQIRKFTQEGITTAAVAFVNACKNPRHERRFKKFLARNGFKDISVSTDLSTLIKFIPRAETTVVNAYLAPVIGDYLKNIIPRLNRGSLHVMTSAGGLVRAAAYKPKDSLLSGPAGGVVGASAIGKLSGYDHLITFDMGGTSTDVARYDHKFEYLFELEVGQAHIFSPAIALKTVAAGGGSICYFDGFKLGVGPQSAGAFPGPACYGAGGPLTITDVNLLLGRLDIQQFQIPLFTEQAEKRLAELVAQMVRQTKKSPPKEEILQGFLHIANEIMAGAIRKISVAKGYDPAQYALIAFGGAGGLHACGIAQLLNIPTILIPKDAGLLSAFGLAHALVERFAESQLLQPYDAVKEQLKDAMALLEKEAAAQVLREGVPKDNIEIRLRTVYLRFKGQDAGLEVPFTDEKQIIDDFRKKYENTYGHWVDNQEIEVESIRAVASARTPIIKAKPQKAPPYSPKPAHYIKSFIDDRWQKVPVFIRDQLKEGAVIEGFALLLDKHSTAVIEKQWRMQIDAAGTGVMKKISQKLTPDGKIKAPASQSHQIELELFTNRFMSIAENMGAMLQRTSRSVNVKERLDFSCALLDARGDLVANAPHIPVHLGSLGVCLRSLIEHMPFHPGDTVLTNHPRFGGSHLPDITLVTPVHWEDKNLIGFVVNRAHHAEIGGTQPASMPAHARTLVEEGVIIEPFYLVKNRKVDWPGIRKILTQAPYPSRAVEENLADINAALAANRFGELALQNLVRRHGLQKVLFYKNLLKDHAARKMAQTLQKIPNGVYRAKEFLDDGTALSATVSIRDNNCIIDFTGSADVHPGNLNANRAVVSSVVIYVLRLLLNEPIPLNDGIFQPVKLIIPKGILNPDFPDDPYQCPAVVGGNVETSQRLTDTLLKAFGVAACSQGTMNNVLFGNDNYSYYETICGGGGAGKDFDGASAVHHHMTNTRITDPEIMEHRYPVRLERFEIKKDSGGAGLRRGGDGVVREITFLAPASLSVCTQHRRQRPYGLNGGRPGQKGRQYIRRANGDIEPLKGIDDAQIKTGDRFIIETPGGGGWGDSAAPNINL
ncbi:MAG: 5-oxoprolinase [Phycisphaerae bacterium SM23_30]|nr:MAG: 5-oxoprolinase [Phycisphaerae bacterium SM23_30]